MKYKYKFSFTNPIYFLTLYTDVALCIYLTTKCKNGDFEPITEWWENSKQPARIQITFRHSLKQIDLTLPWDDLNVSTVLYFFAFVLVVPFFTSMFVISINILIIYFWKFLLYTINRKTPIRNFFYHFKNAIFNSMLQQ